MSDLVTEDGAPKGWVLTTLEELGHLYCGQSPSAQDVNTEGRGTPYVTGPEQWDGHKLSMHKWTTDPRRVVPDGCIFITVKGAGVGTIFPGQASAIGRDVYAFKPVDGLSTKFVELALQFNVAEVLRHAVGDIPGLSKAHILEHEIGLPGWEEQKRIVAEIEKQFSRLDEAVASLKRVQANLKRYKAAVLKAAVEGKLTEEWRTQHPQVEPGGRLLDRVLAARRARWEEAEFEKMGTKGKVPNGGEWKTKYKRPDEPNVPDLCELPEGWCWVTVDTIAFVTKLAGFEYTRFVKYDEEGDLAVIKAENVGREGFKQTTFSHVRSESVVLLARSKLQIGDLLLPFVGNLGNVARVPGDQPYFLGPNVGMIRVTSPLVLPAYLELFIRSPIGRELTLGFAKAVAQPSLSMGTIRKIPVALPPMAEQLRIVTDVEARSSVASKLVDALIADIRRADRLRQSILQKAFSGRLVPEDPNDEPASVLLDRIRAGRVATPGRVGSAHRPQRRNAGNAVGGAHPTSEKAPCETRADQASRPNHYGVAAAILRFLEPGKEYARADVMAALGLTVEQWNGAIRELKESGAVVQTGERRGARYLVG